MSQAKEKEKILYIATHGPGDPERATLPFVLANAALAMGVEAVVALQGDAVWLGVKGTASHVFAGGLPPLQDLLDGFLELGGKAFGLFPLYPTPQNGSTAPCPTGSGSGGCHSNGRDPHS